MHRPPLLLTKADSSQLSTIATIHRTAFAPTLWFQSLWGKCSPEAFDAWFVKKAQGWLEGESDHFIVAMRGDEVLGYALWEEKEGPEAGEVEAEESWPEGTNVAVADGFNRDMHKYTSKIEGCYWRELSCSLFTLDPRSKLTLGAGRSSLPRYFAFIPTLWSWQGAHPVGYRSRDERWSFSLPRRRFR